MLLCISLCVKHAKQRFLETNPSLHQGRKEALEVTMNNMRICQTDIPQTSKLLEMKNDCLPMLVTMQVKHLDEKTATMQMQMSCAVDE